MRIDAALTTRLCVDCAHALPAPRESAGNKPGELLCSKSAQVIEPVHGQAIYKSCEWMRLDAFSANEDGMFTPSPDFCGSAGRLWEPKPTGRAATPSLFGATND
jgi:hypothetical protein